MRRVVIVAFPRVQTLDVHGPAEVFTTASQLSPRDGYAVEVVSRAARAAADVERGALPRPHDRSLQGADRHAAGRRRPGRARAAEDERLVAWLRGRAGALAAGHSVCTGAFLLAAAACSTAAAPRRTGLVRRARPAPPEVEVEPDPIFVRDGDVNTSAGVTAGMDLALALVEEDLGREWRSRPPAGS